MVCSQNFGMLANKHKMDAMRGEILDRLLICNSISRHSRHKQINAPSHFQRSKRSKVQAHRYCHHSPFVAAKKQSFAKRKNAEQRKNAHLRTRLLFIFLIRIMYTTYQTDV